MAERSTPAEPATPDLPPPPRDRIDPERAEDLAYWVDTVGVSREALLKVIEIAGNRAEDVQAYIREQGLPGDSST
jgi:hypothetical protein